jgi:hypothetical protein
MFGTMKLNVNELDTVDISATPNECPFFRSKIIPNFLIAQPTIQRVVELIFACPNEGCKRTFVRYYELYPSGATTYRGVSIGTRISKQLEPIINEISPDFSAEHSDRNHVSRVEVLH